MNTTEILNKLLNRPTYTIDSDFRIVETKDALPEEHKEWAIKHGGFDQVPYKGAGQRIAILDTGVDVNHQDLQGQVNQHEFVPRPGGALHFHGSFCAGEVVAKANDEGIIGVAPNATCFSGRVLYGDSRDRTINFESVLSEAIRASVAEGCGVISMSLGGSGSSVWIEDAIQYATDRGVIVFAAAGNEGMDGSPYRSYPAAYGDVISVAASNQDDLPSWFSTEGIGNSPHEQPEIAISSLEFYWGCVPDNKYGMAIGTSMACPMAAGVCLLWRQKMESLGQMPKNRNALREFRKWMQQVANDTNENGWDKALGWGVLLLEEGEL